MGYRSQIRIIMKKDNYNELVEKCRKKFENRQEYNLLSDKNNLDEYTERDNGNIVLFGWDYIKWYDGYEDVDCITEYLRQLQDKDIPFKLVEVGEDGAIDEMYSECIYDNEEYSQKFDVIRGITYIDVEEE